MPLMYLSDLSGLTSPLWQLCMGMDPCYKDMTVCHYLPCCGFQLLVWGFPVNVTPGSYSAHTWPKRAEELTPRGRFFAQWKMRANVKFSPLSPWSLSRGDLRCSLNTSQGHIPMNRAVLTLSNSPLDDTFVHCLPILPTSLIIFLSLVLWNCTYSNNNYRAFSCWIHSKIFIPEVDLGH